jgi:hypothetical protein
MSAVRSGVHLPPEERSKSAKQISGGGSLRIFPRVFHLSVGQFGVSPFPKNAKGVFRPSLKGRV